MDALSTFTYESVNNLVYRYLFFTNTTAVLRDCMDSLSTFTYASYFCELVRFSLLSIATAEVEIS